MSFLNFIWILINILLIVLILIRSPNEQSFQEIIGFLKFFESSSSAEKNIDNLIKILICIYFFIGFIFIIKIYL
jgi:preprotein translocase subunit SecG|uniref:Unidentified reading frame 2 n=1 Tax=Vaucheria litorea TaxID=109269 RepID=B7T228_VAULI|nr:unidentified reading frame 2 [Vaucheria litorea]ACF70994.1 unidentified reading frame 2 [Vaucheria litorea]